MPYNVVLDQMSMALDPVRNKVYFQELDRIITPDSVVLDLGAGLGVLGLYAAKLGAKHVYMVEPEAVIKLIPKIARDNGLSDKISCLRGTIEEVTLPEKVDVIISVFTGNFLLNENLLPSLFQARDKYLKPDGVLLPKAGEMWLTPVSNEKFYTNRISNANNEHYGLDLSALHPFACNEAKAMNAFEEEHYLCKPQCLKRIDFASSSASRCHEEVEFLISKSVDCHGFLGWLEIDLGGQILSTGPHAPKTHWSPIYFPCESPIALSKGELLTISVHKDGESPWSWSFKTDTVSQTQSGMKTWLEMPKLR